MITEHDLEQAIAECQGERNPNANTCIKLAAFYTIRNELFGTPDRSERREESYSYAAPPGQDSITYDGESDFARTIHGMDHDRVWSIMDELMDTVQALMPRLYDGVMRRLQE